MKVCSHWAAPPLEQAAWPLYVRLCAAKGGAVNRFEFITWLCAKTRPHILAARSIAAAKVETLAEIARDIELAELEAGAGRLAQQVIAQAAE